MDCYYYFMEMKLVLNAQTMSEESVTCIAVKEDRRQNIMEQCCVGKGSRGTVDNREGGESSLTSFVTVTSR